ncbi:hypothetical protein PHYSODRAFT_389914, partial [Phytophthora sojae]
TSNNDKWQRAAELEPRRLIRLVERFPFATDVLQAVSDDVLIAWTAAWRKDCRLAGLIQYRGRTTDKSIHTWLDDWTKRLAEPPTKEKRAPPFDNCDDWKRMRSRAYGDDSLLQQCDFGNTLKLAQHILCAIIYDPEIRAITGTEDDVENGVPTQVRRHLTALDKIESYKAAYYAADRQINWAAVESYFTSTFER